MDFVITTYTTKPENYSDWRRHSLSEIERLHGNLLPFFVGKVFSYYGEKVRVVDMSYDLATQLEIIQIEKV